MQFLKNVEPKHVAIGVAIGALIVGLPAVLVLGGIGLARWLWTRKVVRRWKRALRRLGFTAFQIDNKLYKLTLTARRGPHELEVRTRLFGKLGSLHTTEVTVRGPEVPVSITASEVKRGALASLLGRDDSAGIATGDAAFDAAFEVRGDAVEVRARLDGLGRDAIRRLAEQGAHLDPGRVWVKDKGVAKGEPLAHAVAGLISAATDLSLEGRTALQALRDHVDDDTEPEEVRLRCLRTVLQHSHRPEATQAARAAVISGVPRLCFEGAKAMGEEGVVHLVELVSQESAGFAVRRDALRALTEHPPERIAGAFEVALCSREGRLAAEAARLAEGEGMRWLGPAIAEAAADAEDGPAAVMAKALGALGAAEGEPALIALLGRKTRGVRIAAAVALAEVGTPAAIEFLLPLTEGLFTPGEVKRTAREAVDRIRERMGDVEAGWLSLAAPGEGQGAVSLAVPGEGQGAVSLAVPGEEEGALSLLEEPAMVRLDEEAR